MPVKVRGIISIDFQQAMDQGSIELIACYITQMIFKNMPN